MIQKILLEATPKLHRMIEECPQIRAAFEIAESAHRNQFRQFTKEKIPYIIHPMAVAEYFCPLLEGSGRIMNTRRHIICAALLHDVLEDTSWTAEQLLVAGVEKETVEIVKELTKLPEQSYTNYIHCIKVGSEEARYIKLKDIQHNLLTMPEKGSLRDKYELALEFLWKEQKWY